METKTLYDFIFSLSKSYEISNDRAELIDNLSRSLSLFFPLCEVKIYLMDEYSYLLKDFTKPWENLSSDKKIKECFDNFLIKKSTYEIKDDCLYFPVIQKNKTLGVVEIISKGKIKKDMTKVLSEMIKLKLQDSPRRVKELLNMLNEEIETTKRGIRIWYEEEFAQQRDEFQKELAQMEKQHIQELNQKTNELNQKEQEYVQELNQKEQEYVRELNQKEREHVRELNQKEDLITKQKRHIADLEAMLKIHGLF